MLYTVLTSDVIESRKIKNRGEVQRDLEIAINYLNKVYIDNIKTPVEIVFGDSIQGVFSDPSNAFLYLRMLQMLMHPVKLRSGIGIGEVVNYLEGEIASFLDGKAFHRARQAIDKLEKVKTESLCIIGNDKVMMDYAQLNTYINLYIKQKSWLGPSGTNVSLINEILNPLSMDLSNYLHNDANIYELIERKYYHNLTTRRNYSSRHDHYETIKKLNFNVLWDSDKILFNIHDVLKSNTYLYQASDFVTRGIQTHISEILGVSRQNIQKIFSNALQDERMHAAMICERIRDLTSE